MLLYKTKRVVTRLRRVTTPVSDHQITDSVWPDKVKTLITNLTLQQSWSEVDASMRPTIYEVDQWEVCSEAYLIPSKEKIVKRTWLRKHTRHMRGSMCYFASLDASSSEEAWESTEDSIVADLRQVV